MELTIFFFYLLVIDIQENYEHVLLFIYDCFNLRNINDQYRQPEIVNYE